MSNKSLVGLCIIILLFLGGVFFFVSKQSSKSPPATTPAKVTPTVFQLKEVTVTLTKDGFSPKKITINKGEGVRWINKSGEKASLNSADHPTHKKFPEINLGEFADKTMLNHVFTKVGTYEYHNHYLPSQTATIIVE